MNPEGRPVLRRIALAIMALLTLLPADVLAVRCSAESGARRVPLLELYTSEGCDSCPPVDRWVSSLPSRGLSAGQVVTLAFHVDYWNYLGWTDPYARSEFSARQRAASQRSQARVVYTPQLLLNGKDYRRGFFKDTFAGEIAALNRTKPGARILLNTAIESAGILSIGGSATVPDPAGREDVRAYLALYENRLTDDIKAGENRGKRLRHDFVVRAFIGPLPLDTHGVARFDQRLPLDARWKLPDLSIAAFVQNQRTGDVLQALALPHCGGSGSAN
jgi:hypothetical protein